MRRECAGDKAAAASDIEHPIRRAGLAGRDDQVELILVPDRRGGVEDVGLPGELVANQILVGCVAHTCRSNRARPWADKVTAPSARYSTRSSLSASSQAQFSGQVLLHAARTSATERGFASSHWRNCTIRN